MSEKQTHSSKNKSINKKTNHKKPSKEAKSKKEPKFIANLQFSSSTEDEVENIKNTKQVIRNTNKNSSEYSSSENQVEYKKSSKQSVKLESKKVNKFSDSETSLETPVIAKGKVHAAKVAKVEVNKQEDSSSSEISKVATKEVHVLKKAKSDFKNVKKSSDTNSSSSKPSDDAQRKVNAPKRAKVQIQSVADLSSLSSENDTAVTKKPEHVYKNEKPKSKNVEESNSSLSDAPIVAKKEVNVPKNEKLKSKKAESSSDSSLSEAPVVAKKEVKATTKAKNESYKEEDSSSSDIPKVSTKEIQVSKRANNKSKKVKEFSDTETSSESSVVAKEKMNAVNKKKAEINKQKDSSNSSSSESPQFEAKKPEHVFQSEKSKSKNVEESLDSETSSETSVVVKEKVNVSKKAKIEIKKIEDSSSEISKVATKKIDVPKSENLKSKKIQESSDTDSSSETPVIVKKEVHVSKKTKVESKNTKEALKKTERQSLENSKGTTKETFKKQKIEISTSDENTVIPEIRASKLKKEKFLKITEEKSSEVSVIAKKPRVTFKKNFEEKELSDSSNTDEKSDEEWKPKKSEQREKYGNEENKIVVKNIPQEVSETEIEEIFSKFGPIADMRMPPAFEKTSINKHRGVCFIVYKSPSSIEKAVKVTKIQNKPIEVVKAERNYKLKRNTNSVFVGNLPYDAKPEEIKKFFKSLKIEIGDIRLPRNQEGRCKGFCFMEVTEGKEKLLKTKFIFKERHLKINSAEAKEGHSQNERRNNPQIERRGDRHSSSERKGNFEKFAPRNPKREFTKSDRDFKNRKPQKIIFENSSEN